VLKNKISPVGHISKTVLSFTPIVASMYLLYWLEQSGTWVPETAHRDKITIAIVAVGMVLSFLLHSQITKRAKK